ncbi:MAG: hypothetical protein ACRELY_10160 [Polyangiaceae bacterium]
MAKVGALYVVAAAAMLAIATGCKDSSADQRAGTPSASTPTASNHVDGKNYKIDAKQVGDCAAGSACAVAVRLEAQGEYHINGEYPYKLKADGAGVEFLGTDAAGKNTFSKSAGDFVADPGTPPKAGTMTVKFKPAGRGTVTINGTFKMSVCSAQNCQLETQEISAAVTAK